MEITIHISYEVENTGINKSKADTLYLEFDRRFKEVFNDAELRHTFISKLKKEDKKP